MIYWMDKDISVIDCMHTHTLTHARTHTKFSEYQNSFNRTETNLRILMLISILMIV